MCDLSNGGKNMPSDRVVRYWSHGQIKLLGYWFGHDFQVYRKCDKVANSLALNKVRGSSPREIGHKWCMLTSPTLSFIV